METSLQATWEGFRYQDVVITGADRAEVAVPARPQLDPFRNAASVTPAHFLAIIDYPSAT